MKKFLLASALTLSLAFAQYPIGGSFLNFERTLAEGGLAYELDSMKAVNATVIVVVAIGQFVGPDAGTICSASDISGLSYKSSRFGVGTEKLGLLMSLAETRDMQVFIGSLQTQGAWDSPRLRACNKAVNEELYNRYLGTTSHAGFYYAQEIFLNSFLWYNDITSVKNALSLFIADLAQVAPGKLVLAAPYFKKDIFDGTSGLTPHFAGVAIRWLMDQTGLKLVAPQDGVGSQQGAPPLSETAAYYNSMKSVLNSGETLWSVLETFEFSSSVNQDKYPPAGMARIAQQVTAEQSQVSRILTWMFGRDMSPQSTYYPIEASQLLMDYKTQYGGTVRLQRIPFTYLYGLGHAPSSSYSDSSFSLLSNRVGGGHGATNGEWVGFSDVEDSNVATVTLIFGQNRNV